MESSETKQAEIPHQEYYFRPVDPNVLKDLSPKMEICLKSMEAKLTSAKPVIFLKHENLTVQDQNLSALFSFSETIPDLSSYSSIIDAVSFINYVKDKEELKQIKQVKTVEVDLLKKLFDAVKEKSVLLLLLDIYSIKQIIEAFKKALGDKYMHKLFIKFYVLNRAPFLCLLYVQKMGESKEPLVLENEKLLLYELYEDNTMTKPISYQVKNLLQTVTYMYNMYQKQDYLKVLHPGEVFPLTIKENFYSDNVQCSFTIVDSNIPELIKTKTCVAIIIGKPYLNEFIYLSIEGYLNICRQAKASRVIIIRPAPFNHDEITEIKQKMSSYILLFRFEECSSESIPVLLMTDEKIESHEVFSDKNFFVRDVVTKARKETFRQLVYYTSPNESQWEIKLLLTSKAKIKQDKDSNYISLPTQEKFSKKGLVSCFDDSFLTSFYVRTLLSGVFFLDLSKFPQEPLKILIIGGGIGLINYFYDKILYSKVNIDVVERSKELVKIGKEYFGTNHYDKEKNNIKWHFGDEKEFLMKRTQKDYYDLIAIDVSTDKEDISPPQVFFENEVLEKIKSLMKEKGMFIVNLMARNSKKYVEGFNALDKVFPLIFLLENNDNLSKIHFCFKNKLTNEDYAKLYKANLDKLRNKENADIQLIDKTHEQILRRVVDTEEFKKNLGNYLN